jgi:hypothetical protein
MSNNRPKSRPQFESLVFITEAELAARWRHSLRSVQRWREDGSGPPWILIGRRIVYRIGDVEAFEADREFGR